MNKKVYQQQKDILKIISHNEGNKEQTVEHLSTYISLVRQETADFGNVPDDQNEEVFKEYREILYYLK